jgi:hypothetical protein
MNYVILAFVGVCWAMFALSVQPVFSPERIPVDQIPMPFREGDEGAIFWNSRNIHPIWENPF